MWLLWILVGMVLASIPWFFVWRNNKKRAEELDAKVSQYIDVIQTEINQSGVVDSVKVKLNSLLAKLKS